MSHLLDLQDGWWVGSEVDRYLAHGMVNNCLFPATRRSGGYKPDKVESVLYCSIDRSIVVDPLLTSHLALSQGGREIFNSPLPK